VTARVRAGHVLGVRPHDVDSGPGDVGCQRPVPAQHRHPQEELHGGQRRREQSDPAQRGR
jgi:hypothetical protein